MSPYYNIEDDIKLCPEALYYLVIGERSNGKTYSTMVYCLKMFFEKDITFAYIRRWKEDFQQGAGKKLFEGINKNGVVKKLSKGRWQAVRYYNMEFFLVNYDEDGNVIERGPTIGWAFALTSEEHYKSTSYSTIKIIVFDELLARSAGYLPNEFVTFCNLLSTIIRLKDDCKIIMLGNTISKYGCPYFREMGLRHIKLMKKGSYDVYQFTDKLSVMVRYSDFKAKDKPSDKYFAFDNPKLKMITNGSWEISIYPHLKTPYEESEIEYRFFICYEGEILQCELIHRQKDDSKFIYIHQKTTRISDKNTNLVYSPIDNPLPWYRLRLTDSTTPLERVINMFFIRGKVFYQDNEVGELVNAYLSWCKGIAIR